MKPIQIRQGDVLLHPTTKLTESVQQQLKLHSEHSSGVLLQSKVNGNPHAVTKLQEREVFENFTDDPQILAFLSVKSENTPLSHREHAMIPVPQGNYEVRRQREFWGSTEDQSTPKTTRWVED